VGLGYDEWVHVQDSRVQDSRKIRAKIREIREIRARFALLFEDVSNYDRQAQMGLTHEAGLPARRRKP